MSFLSEAQIPHRRNRNIPKSPPAAAVTESTIQDQDRITDRQLLLEGEEAASSSSSTNKGEKRGIDPYVVRRGSLLSAETLLGGCCSAVVEAIRGSALPALVPWTIIFSLIFGGCCSNVGFICSFLHKDNLPGARIEIINGRELTFFFYIYWAPDRSSHWRKS